MFLIFRELIIGNSYSGLLVNQSQIVGTVIELWNVNITELNSVRQTRRVCINSSVVFSRNASAWLGKVPSLPANNLFFF